MAEGIKIIAENRRARAEYAIEETYEAGIALRGTEVKSLREGRANLKESFAEAGPTHHLTDKLGQISREGLEEGCGKTHLAAFRDLDGQIGAVGLPQQAFRSEQVLSVDLHDVQARSPLTRSIASPIDLVCVR